MIILNRTQIRNVILRYDALYNGMVAQREEQEAYIEESKGYWLGKSGEAYRKAHCKLIREGAYAKYLEAVKEIRDIFDESMPHLNELQNMCAEMPNQLGQCGITGGPTEVLMLNENYLDTFNDQIEETLRLNQLTHDVMESIMDGCEGLCDVGITRRLNEEAYEQQSRLRNLLDYINLYAVKLKKLDCELSDRYRGILHKIVEQPAVGITESTNDYAWDTIRRILVEERGWSETEADDALYYLQSNNPTGLSQLESFNQNGAYPAYDRQLDYLLSECDKLRTREEFVQWLLCDGDQLYDMINCNCISEFLDEPLCLENNMGNLLADRLIKLGITQEEIIQIWEACKVLYTKYNILFDPVILLAILAQEGNGSFNTSSSNPAADGQHGYEADFALDLLRANDLMFGKLVGYMVYGEEFQQALEQNHELFNGEVDGSFAQYANWKTPIVSLSNENTRCGVYAMHGTWYEGVTIFYESIRGNGSMEDYSNYLLSVDDEYVMNLTSNVNINDYTFSPEQNSQNSDGSVNGEYTITAK